MMNVSNFSTVDPAIESFRYFGIAIGLIDIFAGTAGNLMTIVAIVKNRQLRKNIFNMFILNLSIIDLLTALLMMPFNVTGYILMKWPFSVRACILQAFFYFSCGYTSVVCLMSITLNRLYGVVFPDRYNSHFSENRVRLWIFLSWIIAPLFLLPFFTVSLLNTVNNEPLITGWRSDQLLCTFVSLPGSWQPYMQMLRFLFQFVPAPFMVVSYSAMVYLVHKSNKRMDAVSTRDYCLYKHRMLSKLNSTTSAVEQHPSHGHSEEAAPNNSDFDNVKKNRSRGKPSLLTRLSQTVIKVDNRTDFDEESAETNCPDSYQRSKGETHLIYLSIIICSAFTILFLPSLVLNLIPGNHNFDPRIHMGVSNLTWLNSCVNPFVYVLVHKGMRSEYKSIIKQAFGKFSKRSPTITRQPAEAARTRRGC